MLTHSTRRWLAGLGVAGAFVAASASPAVAAPTPAEARAAQGFDLYANNIIIAPEGPEKWVSLYSLVEQPLTDYTVTVDRSAVSGFAEVQNPEGPGSCTETTTVITCTVKDQQDAGVQLLALTVLARDAAKAGQVGELRFTVTTPGAGTESFRSTITIGEGVDLVSEPFVELNGAPGATVKTPLSVGNTGEKTAKDVVLFYFGSYGLAPKQRYENCEYTEEDFDAYAFACKLDVTLASGDGAKLDSSFGFAIPGDTWAPSGHYGFATWLTPADWEAFRAEVPTAGELGEKGTDGVLKLEPVAKPKAFARSAQTDVNPSNNETLLRLEVQGDQQADVAANGASVSAAVGKTVPVKVGFTNNGPAAINAGGDQGLYTLAVVTLPKGTTAVEAPETCADAEGEFGEDSGKPGAAVYTCFVDHVLGKGKTAEFPFSLKVTDSGSLEGSIELIHGSPDENLAKDLVPSNDVAKILVNATGGTGGGDGGDGGSLPITGQSTGLIAGLGALLLAAGVGGYLVAKRRRTRFVA
ncbi:cell wall anchor protein [Micromonospora ureilytica]|uniref:Cell wall anchor protein n=1 Tax=Micromonospora ureilytica TaxID=709868 RepID=A0A3N9XWV9_9ACTN|nr:LPXTG cell wall anchor domain-containing protein [Micromonospora ureilytica]RQX17329.1 cell wall anchor protein [Micromonospora ureilytica]